jgi:hypothetical protein
MASVQAHQNSGTRLQSKMIALVLAIACAGTLAAPSPAQAQTLTVLHEFTGGELREPGGTPRNRTSFTDRLSGFGVQPSTNFFSSQASSGSGSGAV